MSDVEISIHDVAAKAGVSLATVSQVFRNPTRVSPAYREKVLAAAEELNYLPRFIRKRAAYGNVGVLIDQNRGPFGEYYSHIIMGILEQAKKLKWNISFELYNSTIEKTFPPMIIEKRVDAVLLLSKHEDAYIERIIKRGIPYCIVDYRSDKIKHNCVHPNWKQGAKLAVKYLLKQGHRDIAMIYSPLEKGQASLARIEGFNEAFNEAGLEPPDGCLQDGEFNYQVAYKKTLILLSRKPRFTAIFCATDVMALGAYKAIREKGLRIPDDISIVGFDNIEWPYYVDQPDPPITTIDVDKRLLGQKALQFVHDIIVHRNNLDQKVILPMNLIEKGSVKKIG